MKQFLFVGLLILSASLTVNASTDVMEAPSTDDKAMFEKSLDFDTNEMLVIENFDFSVSHALVVKHHPESGSSIRLNLFTALVPYSIFIDKPVNYWVGFDERIHFTSLLSNKGLEFKIKPVYGSINKYV